MRVHLEGHRSERIGWLRAAVLGANDGILSTASLVVGVAAAETGRSGVLLAGVAGLVAGAMAMGAGEYVSVSSQADTEAADRRLEVKELAEQPEAELAELQRIYEARGLAPELAREVAAQMTRHDALGTHLRDELGLTEVHTARPVQAALASMASFAVGAVLPLVVAALAPVSSLEITVSGASLLFLALLGTVSARAGGAPAARAVVRICFWGALAMIATGVIGKLFGGVIA